MNPLPLTKIYCATTNTSPETQQGLAFYTIESQRCGIVAEKPYPLQFEPHKTTWATSLVVEGEQGSEYPAVH